MELTKELLHGSCWISPLMPLTARYILALWTCSSRFRKCDIAWSDELLHELVSFVSWLTFDRRHCERVIGITIPYGVEIISDSIGVEPRFLNQVEMPDTVKKIGDWFLSGCRYLKRIRLSNSLVQVGNHFLSGCCDLLEIDLPNTLESSGTYFLFDCTKLHKIKPMHIFSTKWYRILFCIQRYKCLVVKNSKIFVRYEDGYMSRIC